MSALDVLEWEHRAIDSLFIVLQGQPDIGFRRDALDQIRGAILRHIDMEETCFYAPCSELSQLRELIEHSLDEHQAMKDFIIELSEERSVEELDGLVTQLIELFERHVEEEEAILFPKARELLGKDELEKLGQRMREAQRENLSKSAA